MLDEQQHRTSPGTSGGSSGAPEQRASLSPNIADEISPLKTVIVHEPGGEMERLTPPNHDELLFDDLLSPSRAREEHAYFVETMREEGVNVLEFRDLLEETLSLPKAKDFVLENTVNYKRLGPLLAPALHEWADALDPSDLTQLAIQGITKEEWNQISDVSSLVEKQLNDGDFLIGPLPNHMFTRDASAWMYGGVAVNSMSRMVRRRESLHYSAIYKYHPLFKDADFELWTTGFSGASRSVEGGDILVLGDGVLAVGVSERTTPQGVERLAQRLFDAGRARKVLAVMLPKTREFMHLDTVMTQVDHSTFVIYPLIAGSQCVLLQHEDGKTSVSSLEPNVMTAMERALDRPLKFIWPDATNAELSREQWNDGFNMLALAPGKVVAYTRTPHSNKRMREAGIEVLEIEGSELGRGRGGPRCMSAPVERVSA